MTPNNASRRAALLPGLLAISASLTGYAAWAETRTEHRGEITAESSSYTQGAAHAGQKDSFVHTEARPELMIYGDVAEALIQPRISGGTLARVPLISVRQMLLRVSAMPIFLSAAPSILGQGGELQPSRCGQR